MAPATPSPGTPSPGTPRRDPAAELLARPPDPAYLASWGRSLESPLPSSDAHTHLPAVLVRLGEERFLVPTSVVREVHLPRPVHRVPGRSGAVFRGIVCLRGEVLLCGDLFALLGVARAPGAAPSRARMLVLERDGQRWAVRWTRCSTCAATTSRTSSPCRPPRRLRPRAPAAASSRRTRGRPRASTRAGSSRASRGASRERRPGRVLAVRPVPDEASRTWPRWSASSWPWSPAPPTRRAWRR